MDKERLKLASSLGPTTTNFWCKIEVAYILTFFWHLLLDKPKEDIEQTVEKGSSFGHPPG